jgi:sugar-specific transcriptional regulator TrmB
MLSKKHISIRLQNIGMSSKEVKIFLTLLQLGEALPSTLARRTGINRSTTYMILGNLEWKGMVSSHKSKGYLISKAVDPALFLKKKLKQNMEQNETIKTLIQSLPKLKNFHTISGSLKLK